MQTILRCCCISFLAVSGLSAYAGDETKYDLRGPVPKAGTEFRSTQKFEVKDADLTMTTQGKVTAGKTSMTSVAEFDTKVLAVEGKFVTKYQTKHIGEKSTTSDTIAGQTKTEEAVDPLSGSLVLSEKKGKEWMHTLVDAKPTEPQSKALSEEAGWYDDDDIPEGKLAVGHSWKLDGSHLKRFYRHTDAEISGDGKATFVRVEKHGGELCAVIETSGRFKTKNKDGDAGMEIELKAISYRSLQTGFELESTYNGTYYEFFTTKENNVPTKEEVKGKFSGSETNTITKAAK